MHENLILTSNPCNYATEKMRTVTHIFLQKRTIYRKYREHLNMQLIIVYIFLEYHTKQFRTSLMRIVTFFFILYGKYISYSQNHIKNLICIARTRGKNLFERYNKIVSINDRIYSLCQ